MAYTKAQILSVLERRFLDSSPQTIKRHAMGALWILVNKDIITPEDVAARFPEYA